MGRVIGADSNDKCRARSTVRRSASPCPAPSAALHYARRIDADRRGTHGDGMSHDPTDHHGDYHSADDLERALIARSQRGDLGAFNALVERYQAIAYAL